MRDVTFFNKFVNDGSPRFGSFREIDTPSFI